MISTQPVLSFGYFKFKKNKIPRNIRRLFYLSWEDAFWDILLKKKVPKGSFILLPDFFCKDVEENIKSHGYKVSHYPIKKNLDADKKSFIEKIRQVKPEVVVIFHTNGIKSKLFENCEWLARVTHDIILIEDSVHKIIDPEKINIIKKDHFVINSLRKVVPLQGSELFGDREDLDFSTPSFVQSFRYRLKVYFLWVLTILGWSLVNILPGRLSKKFGLAAEKLMLAGYNLIGDSILPAKGGPGGFLSRRVNFEKIEKVKRHQVDTYERLLADLLPLKLFITVEDKGSMRGFPLILPKNRANGILEFIRSKGLLVRFELDDSVWARNQKIIYLPLGIHMTQRKVEEVCRLTREAILRNF